MGREKEEKSRLEELNTARVRELTDAAAAQSRGLEEAHNAQISALNAAREDLERGANDIKLKGAVNLFTQTCGSTIQRSMHRYFGRWAVWSMAMGLQASHQERLQSIESSHSERVSEIESVHSRAVTELQTSVDTHASALSSAVDDLNRTTGVAKIAHGTSTVMAIIAKNGQDRKDLRNAWGAWFGGLQRARQVDMALQAAEIKMQGALNLFISTCGSQIKSSAHRAFNRWLLTTKSIALSVQHDLYMKGQEREHADRQADSMATLRNGLEQEAAAAHAAAAAEAAAVMDAARKEAAARLDAMSQRSGLSMLEAIMRDLGFKRKMTRAWRKIYTAAVVGQCLKEVREEAEQEAAMVAANNAAVARQLQHEHAVSKCTSLISKFEAVGSRVVFDSWLRQTQFLRSQVRSTYYEVPWPNATDTEPLIPPPHRLATS